MTQLQVPAFFGIRANIDIPAGDGSYKVRGSYTLPVDVDAVSVAAHAHYLAREARITATLPSGEVRILLWIRQWDFNWQDQYIFQDLVPLPKDTRLDGELTYDNSTNNVRNPNTPPKRVKWGENSTDEMGSLILNVVPKNPGEIDVLRAGTIGYILTPVPLVGNKPLLVSSGCGGRRQRAARRGHAWQDRGAVRFAHRSRHPDAGDHRRAAAGSRTHWRAPRCCSMASRPHCSTRAAGRSAPSFPTPSRVRRARSCR